MALTIGAVTTLVIHHSASPLNTTFEAIEGWHTKPKPDGRGWSAIAYHHVILSDGAIRGGRPLTERGAHAPPNRGRIGVCVVGDNTVDGRGWTIEQIATLHKYVEAAILLFGPDLKVCGHRDAMPGHTECPGLDVLDVLGGTSDANRTT